MSVTPSELEVIEEALQEAALDPWRWATALGSVSRCVAGEGAGALAALTFLDGPGAAAGWMLHEAEARTERPVAFDAGGGHALFTRSLTLPEGHVGPSEEFAAPRDLARTTLARAWLADDGSVCGLSAVVASAPTLVAAIHVLARRGRGAWADDAADRMRALLPPLRRAVRLYARLRRAREHAAVDRALLDLLDVAAMSLDPSGVVVRCNEAARAMLARADGLRLDEGRVRCVRAGSDESLQRAIAEASRDETSTAHVLVVARASGRRPLLVFVSGVRGFGGGERGPVAVLVRDVDARGPHAEEVLRGLFGLTTAETRLTLAIAEGRSIDEAAEALGRKRETMRTHLSRVFDKTATTRQAELVRLVLGEFPPVLTGRGG